MRCFLTFQMISSSCSEPRCSSRCLRRSFSRQFRSLQVPTVSWTETTGCSTSAPSPTSCCAGKPPQHTPVCPVCPAVHLTVSWVQVLPGHGEGDHLLLHVLVRSHHHLHHRNHEVSSVPFSPQLFKDGKVWLKSGTRFVLPGSVSSVWVTWWPVSTFCWSVETCC